MGPRGGLDASWGCLHAMFGGTRLGRKTTRQRGRQRSARIKQQMQQNRKDGPSWRGRARDAGEAKDAEAEESVGRGGGVVVWQVVSKAAWQRFNRYVLGTEDAPTLRLNRVVN